MESLNSLPCVAQYFLRVGAEPRSFRDAVVKVPAGKYWQVDDVLRFDKSGQVTCKKDVHKPTEAEQEAISEAFKGIEWPEVKPLARLINQPAMMRKTDPEDVFLFRDASNHIVMVQVRVENESGGKAYVPWTYWSDNQWRCCEPDGPLPLFNADRLKEAPAIFLHEGAKAARHVQWMVDGETPEARQALAEHPWSNELKHAVHVGWIGGAPNPNRTDWSPINESGASVVYIVADNDLEGRSAVKQIAKALRKRTYMIQFNSDFPVSFDLADKFPENMFADLSGGRRIYHGPPFDVLKHNATWASDLVRQEKGRPIIVLRPQFRENTSYVAGSDHFILHDEPQRPLSRPEFNNRFASLSDTDNLARVVINEFTGIKRALAYSPGKKSGLIDDDGTSAVNIFVPSSIRAQEGPTELFYEFLSYMFPVPGEKKSMERWLATLIARPEVRMHYAVLLISKTQGVGKTTLGEAILRPLVGAHNCSSPTEQQLVESQFNAWLGAKRLIISNEIYAGQGWKAYNRLKSVITDKVVEINQKHEKPYTVENWAHVFACSNSERALRMDDDDRRWFIPEVTSVAWPKAKFDELFAYLETGGLGFIKHWAEQYGDYVRPGERPPESRLKRQMIAESRTPAMNAAIDLAERLCDPDDEFGQVPVALIGRDIEAWMRGPRAEKIGDRPDEISRAMTKAGMARFGDRPKWHGRRTFILMNPPLALAVARAEDDAQRRAIMEEAVHEPSKIMPWEM